MGHFPPLQRQEQHGAVAQLPPGGRRVVEILHSRAVGCSRPWRCSSAEKCHPSPVSASKKMVFKPHIHGNFPIAPQVQAELQHQKPAPQPQPQSWSCNAQRCPMPGVKGCKPQLCLKHHRNRRDAVVVPLLPGQSCIFQHCPNTKGRSRAALCAGTFHLQPALDVAFKS